MARAGAASASRPDSIKGLAQSIAKPAYRRLLTAEPVLRRAVPVLIVAFLLTVGIGAVIQVLYHRAQAIADATSDLELIADVIVDRLERVAEAGGTNALVLVQRAIERGLPRQAAAPGRRVFVTDAAGVIVAASPQVAASIGHRPGDVLGRTRSFLSFAPASEDKQITLPDGTAALVVLRPLKTPLGQLAVVHPMRRPARRLAVRHRAHHHAVRHDAVRAADPRLCVPLAVEAGARDRSHLRHGPLPDRHRAQSRPLRPVGLGPAARAASSGRARCSSCSGSNRRTRS